MTDITELAQRMKAAAEKATPGEWWADEVKNEGCYGSGDDCVEGFTSYAIYGSDGQTLFDSLNSDAACICEEYDGEGHVAWDETAQRNAEFIALANPANVLALVEALEKAQQTEKTLESRNRRLDGIITAAEKRIAELDGELEREREKSLRVMSRIAELESHTVKPPVHPTVASEKLDDETLQELIEFRRTTFEYHSKEGNKVQTIIHGVTLAALRELQERRKADSEPVAYTDERNLGYIDRGRETAYLWGKQNSEAADVPLYRHAQPASERDQVRIAHAEWSQATFGNVGPVGQLKHLSKEALEAAAEPGDLSEWADMQFLLWDAQRRAGITDEQITQAMIDKLAVNKQRSWPEPKDGEPKLHIKEQPRKKVDRCDVCTEGARGGCGTCIFNGNFE